MMNICRCRFFTTEQHPWGRIRKSVISERRRSPGSLFTAWYKKQFWWQMGAPSCVLSVNSVNSSHWTQTLPCLCGWCFLEGFFFFPFIQTWWQYGVFEDKSNNFKEHLILEFPSLLSLFNSFYSHIIFELSDHSMRSVFHTLIHQAKTELWALFVLIFKQIIILDSIWVTFTLQIQNDVLI